jgi:hypothetical protein
MWIFKNDSFVNVVQSDADPAMLLVRARLKGDIERAFPGVKAKETKGADYRFKALVSREAFSQAMDRTAASLDYTEFSGHQIKDDHGRRSAYVQVGEIVARIFGAFGMGRSHDYKWVSTGDGDEDAALMD